MPSSGGRRDFRFQTVWNRQPATSQQGAQEEVRQLRVALHQLAKPRTIDPGDLAALHHTRAQIGLLTGEQVQLTEEAAGAVAGNYRFGMLGAGRTKHLDVSAIKDHQVIVELPGTKEYLANINAVRCPVVA